MDEEWARPLPSYQQQPKSRQSRIWVVGGSQFNDTTTAGVRRMADAASRQRNTDRYATRLAYLRMHEQTSMT